MQIINNLELERQKRFLEQISFCQTGRRDSTGLPSRYLIRTYGCQLNENDSEKIAGQLDSMGFVSTDKLEDADLVILNTCSVRENADDRLFGNLGQLKTLKKDNPELLIAICGCMMKQPEHVERVRRSFPYVSLVFGPQDIHRLPEMLHASLLEKQKVFEVGSEDTMAEGLSVHRARKFRALVSIMYGCNNFCTYCIVPFTRGRERSRQPQDILNEIRLLKADGYKEVLLLGQNVNSYGRDLTTESEQSPDFSSLITAVSETGIQRIRFMTSHPKDISDQLLETIGRFDNIEPHLHLPLQSGSNRILKLMNRHYTREQFIEIARKARLLRPGLTISTDIIVGFPGETEADFADTLSLMETIRFDSAFTFQYSRRSGTPAASLPDQIPADILRERFSRLLDLQNSHSLASNEAMTGQLKEVLIEGRSETADSIFTGRTACNKLINFRIPDPKNLPGQFLRSDGQPDGDTMEGHLAMVRLTRAKTFSIEGEMEMFLP